MSDTSLCGTIYHRHFWEDCALFSAIAYILSMGRSCHYAFWWTFL